MPEEFQEKTEEPTQKKLQDSRKKGKVAKSQDFNTSIMLIVSLAILFFLGNFILHRLHMLGVAVFTHLQEPYTSLEATTYWFRSGIFYLVIILSPLLGAAFFTALFSNIYQVGLTFSQHSIMPKWNNMNVFNPSNYKKFFNIQAFVRLLFGVSKMVVVACVGFVMIYSSLPELSHMVKGTVRQLFLFLCWKAFMIGLVISLILLFLGLFDLLFQKWKFRQEMKMSRQEVKDEHKQAEGDAMMKSKVRSMMQSFAQGRMKANVPEADVIIANPVHFAIAVKYNAESMSAPMCVAKGARKMALSIKEIANEHSIPIVENPPLARTLYKVVDVGAFIPPNFYHAIAEVLAYVYRLNEKLNTS